MLRDSGITQTSFQNARVHSFMKLIFSGINHPDLAAQTVDRPPAIITLFRRSHTISYRPESCNYSSNRFQSYLLLLRGIWDRFFSGTFSFIYPESASHHRMYRSDNLPSTLHDKHPSPVRNHRKRPQSSAV